MPKPPPPPSKIKLYVAIALLILAGGVFSYNLLIGGPAPKVDDAVADSVSKVKNDREANPMQTQSLEMTSTVDRRQPVKKP